MISEPVVLGIILVGLIVCLISVVWAYRSDRSMRASIGGLEASLQENSEALSGMLTETQLLIEQLQKTISTEMGEIEGIKDSVERLRGESITDSKQSELDHPGEEDKQPSRPATCGNWKSWWIERFLLEFAGCRVFRIHGHEYTG